MDGQPPGRVEPWLATICLNLGRDRARRAATRLEVTSDTLADHPDGTDVAAEAIHRVQRTQVERALWALPAPQRVAVTLMDLGGFTAAEVAAMLGSPRVLLRADRSFPTAVGARHPTTGATWIAEVDGVVLFCADQPAPSLLLGQDQAEVLVAASLLGLDAAGHPPAP